MKKIKPIYRPAELFVVTNPEDGEIGLGFQFEDGEQLRVKVPLDGVRLINDQILSYCEGVGPAIPIRPVPPAAISSNAVACVVSHADVSKVLQKWDTPGAPSLKDDARGNS